MSVRLASFMFEGRRYFVCLDNDYLQRSFPDRNAVPIEELQINAGYSAAIATPWKAYRPALCPVSGDAKVTKIGDKFVANGTCGGLRFELTEFSYEIEEEKKEPVPVAEEADTVETQDAEITETGDTAEEESIATEEPVVVEESAVEEEVVEEHTTEESATKEDTTEELVTKGDTATKFRGGNISIGSVGRCTFSRNGEFHQKDRAPKVIIGESTMRESNPHRGIKMQYKEGLVLPVSRRDQSAQVKKDRPLFIPRSEENTEEPKRTSVPYKPAPPVIENVSFDNAPKMTDEEFDADEFLKQLSTDQIEFLKKVPDAFLGNISEYTQEPINEVKLKTLGAVYCVQNKWKIAGDWYAIDEIATLSRYIYCSETGDNYRISVKTLKGWSRCKEVVSFV